MVKRNHLLRLRPQKIDLKMNVGDIKYFNFDYWLWDQDMTMTHSFPDNVDVKIFSTCYHSHSFQDVSVKGCQQKSLDSKVDLIARIELKSCPTNAIDWKSQQEIRFLDGGDFFGNYISIEFTIFCSCSCDKPFSQDICRNDKKVRTLCKISQKLQALHQSFLDANHCAEKNSCTECLRDPACNWCTSPSYSHVDGSPLPRCNSDHYFTSYLCPEEGILNPSQALGEDESCDSCDHCAGGVCEEDKEVVLHDIADTD